ncbi:MAG: hypothetical protein LBM76_02550 [Mycoplasmataceae bacterium]|jgi:hypothetical protein|nr:hypothetical protein [Mycoplasmataceae bacterium]
MGMAKIKINDSAHNPVKIGDVVDTSVVREKTGKSKTKQPTTRDLILNLTSVVAALTKDVAEIKDILFRNNLH